MAKRINTPFVTIFGVVCAVAIAAVLLAPRIKAKILQRPPAVLATEAAARAETLFKQGKVTEAVEQITLAHRYDLHNKDYCLRRGEMLDATTGEEGYMALAAARKSWQEALEIDPNCKPALTHLLNSYIDQIEVTGNAQGSVVLRDTAEHLLRVDPNDVRAQAYRSIATIEQWAQGMPKSAAEKDAAVSSLSDIYQKTPTADVLFYLARGKTVQASEQLHAAGADAAMATMADCRALLESARSSHPKEAVFNYRAFQGYQMLLQLDRDPVISKRDIELSKKDPASAKETALTRDTASAGTALAATMSAATDSDPRFSEYHYAAATWARQTQHLDEAEKTLRSLYIGHKTDPRARLELARVLTMTSDPAKRDEAIDLLDRPIVLTGAPADRWISLQELKAETLLDLTSLRVSKYGSLEASKRPAMLAQIEKGYNDVKGMATPNNVPLLRLEGLIDELKGDFLGSVAALSNALTMLEHSDQNNQIKYDLMYQLANVNRQAGQNRAAEIMLVRILEKYDFTPARLQLADLLLQENNLVEAEKQIVILAQKNPEGPDVLQLEIRLSYLQHHPEKVTAYLAKVPEKTFTEKLHKAQLAASVQDYNQTAGLLFQLLEERKYDVGLTIALYNTYLKVGKDQQAANLLAEAIKHDPKEVRYHILEVQKNAKPEDLDKLLDSVVLDDPFKRELEFGRRDLSTGNLDEALKHAVAADQIQPDNSATWELRFRIYAQKGDKAMATQAVEKLSRLDADHAGGRVYRWMLAMGQNPPDYATAITVAREMTEIRSEFAQSWVMLAQAYQGSGQYLDAIKQYQASLERQTTNIDTYLGMAESYDKLSEPDRAREILNQGTHIFPDSVALRERVLSYDTVKDPVAVVPVREKLLADNPEDAENYLALSSAAVHAADRVFASNPERSRGFLEKARDTLTKGVGKFPDHLRLNSALAEALYNANKFDAGVKVLQDLSEVPTWKGKPDPKLMLGEYYVRAKKPELAEAIFREAWKMSGNKNIDIELRMVGMFEDEKRYDDALELLKTNADDPRVQSQTLQVHIAANHTEIAREMLQKKIRENPGNIDYRNLKAVVEIDADRFSDARETIAQTLKLDPDNLVTLYYQALLESRDPMNGDMQLALRNFNLIVTKSPHNVQFKTEYASVLQRVPDLEGAAVQLEDVLAMQPYNVDARLILLDIYTLRQRWQQFEKIVNFAELNPLVGGPKGIWQRSHAYAFAAQNKFDLAVAKIRESMSMDPANEKYTRDYLIILLQSKNDVLVLQEAASAVAQGHREWWLYHIRGLAFLAMGKPKEALEQFDNSIKEIDPVKDLDATQQIINSIAEVSLDEAIVRLKPRLDANPRWRIESVAMNMRKKDWNEAIAELKPLIATRDKLARGERVSVIRLAAECYQSTQQFDLAKSFYLEWLKEAPNDTTALNNTAYLFAEDLNRPREALPFINKAYELGRKINSIDPMIADTYGWVLTLIGGIEANTGLSVLNTVVNEHPKMLEPQYHLAKAYLKRHQPDSAIPVLNTALDIIKEMEDRKELVDPKLKKDIQAALDEAKSPGSVTGTAVGR